MNIRFQVKSLYLLAIEKSYFTHDELTRNRLNIFYTYLRCKYDSFLATITRDNSFDPLNDLRITLISFAIFTMNDFDRLKL